MRQADLTQAAWWSAKYLNKEASWDIGSISRPLESFFSELSNKTVRILIPGAGYGWEAAYLFRQGFSEVYVLDFAPETLAFFKQNNPGFPDNHLMVEDFFQHQGSYDLIVEQTFFCAISRKDREEYMRKMANLLSPGGLFCGLLFNHEFDHEGPPFGGTAQEYRQLFESFFNLERFETAKDSIKPRSGRELFFVARKRSDVFV